MLHILEMFGRGIGITLLCLLLLVVLILLLLLFVPFRYRLWGTKAANDKMPYGDIRISWLLRMVSFRASWEGSVHYVLRVLGIPILHNTGKAEKKKKKEQDGHKQQETEVPQLVSKYEPKKNAGEDASSGEIPWKEEPHCMEENDKAQEKPVSHPVRRAIERIKALWKRICDFFKRLASIPHKICGKATHIKETFDFYRNILESREFERAFALCKKHLWRLWKDIRPKLIKIDAHFGFDDPSITGQILAINGMLYPILGKAIILRPEFEEEMLKADVLIKGRLTLFVWLKAIIVLYFNKDIKFLIQVLKKEEVLNGRQ